MIFNSKSIEPKVKRKYEKKKPQGHFNSKSVPWYRATNLKFQFESENNIINDFSFFLSFFSTMHLINWTGFSWLSSRNCDDIFCGMACDERSICSRFLVSIKSTCIHSIFSCSDHTFVPVDVPYCVPFLWLISILYNFIFICMRIESVPDGYSYSKTVFFSIGKNCHWLVGILFSDDRQKEGKQKKPVDIDIAACSKHK